MSGRSTTTSRQASFLSHIHLTPLGLLFEPQCRSCRRWASALCHLEQKGRHWDLEITRLRGDACFHAPCCVRLLVERERARAVRACTVCTAWKGSPGATRASTTGANRRTCNRSILGWHGARVANSIPRQAFFFYSGSHRARFTLASCSCPGSGPSPGPRGRLQDLPWLTLCCRDGAALTDFDGGQTPCAAVPCAICRAQRLGNRCLEEWQERAEAFLLHPLRAREAGARRGEGQCRGHPVPNQEQAVSGGSDAQVRLSSGTRIIVIHEGFHCSPRTRMQKKNTPSRRR